MQGRVCPSVFATAAALGFVVSLLGLLRRYWNAGCTESTTKAAQLRHTIPTAACSWPAVRRLGDLPNSIVEYPPFVEFLIATEAEMNKVSWTSRADLYRATTVVLVTVTLMSVFLFGVDWLWSSLLQFLGVVLKFCGRRSFLRL